MIAAFRNIHPRLDPSVFVAPSATIVGNVEIGAGSSVWFNAVIRADLNDIRIGERTSVQDNCVLHVDTGERFMRIGNEVTIGHGTVLHGCIIGNQCLIGMGSVVLNKARIGECCIVAAGSVVAPGVEVEDHTLLVGVPAKPKRKITEEDLQMIRSGVQEYYELSREYLPLGANLR